MPLPSESALAAYRQALNGGLAIPLPDRACWRLTGPDARRYLNGQITNSLLDLEPGHARYAAVCTAKGRMEGDVWVGWDGGALHIDADASLRESLGARLDKYLIADDAELVDVTDEYCLTHVIGAAPQDFLSKRFGPEGVDFWLSPNESAPGTALPDAEAAAEILRIEHGLASWGVDMDEKTLPPEAGFDRHGISYTKGCYVGQETIARIKSIGHVNRELLVLACEGDDAPAPGTELHAEGEDKPCGHVTSATWSPALGKGIALGYVRRQHAATGTILRADTNRVEIIPPPCAVPSLT